MRKDYRKESSFADLSHGKVKRKKQTDKELSGLDNS